MYSQRPGIARFASPLLNGRRKIPGKNRKHSPQKMNRTSLFYRIPISRRRAVAQTSPPTHAMPGELQSCLEPHGRKKIFPARLRHTAALTAARSFSFQLPLFWRNFALCVMGNWKQPPRQSRLLRKKLPLFRQAERTPSGYFAKPAEKTCSSPLALRLKTPSTSRDSIFLTGFTPWKSA